MVGKEWPLQDESQVKMAMKGNKESPSWSWRFVVPVAEVDESEVE